MEIGTEFLMRAASGLPFDDIRNLLSGLPGPDKERWVKTRDEAAARAWPVAAFGRLAPMAEWLAAWQAEGPMVLRPLLAVFASTHGAAARGLAPAGEPDTQKQVELMAAGGALVNQIALDIGMGLKVFDLALDMPTPDIGEDDALDEPACAATMAFGMEAIAGGADLLCLGAAGSGNRAVAAALAAALFGGRAEDWLEGLMPDIADPAKALVEAALARTQGDKDPLELLRKLGGREMAAIAGAILAARYQRIPVLLDGFVSTAAAAVLFKANPRALDHCMAAHSAGPAHDRLLKELGLKPVLNYAIEAEHGLGAALAASQLKQAVAIIQQTAPREDGNN